MKTVQIQRFRKAGPTPGQDDHKHAGEKFCGPCAANTLLVFFTTQWPAVLIVLAVIAALVYYF